MRHPGFGLQPDVDVPDAVLHYLAAQLFVDVDAFADYGQRAQTRNDHADIAARHLGLHPFRRGDIPLALDLAARAAERTDRGEPIRSEEHTSELQSLMRISYAVFCLKKKNNTNTH